MKRINCGTRKHFIVATIVFSSVLMTSNISSAFGLGDITRPISDGLGRLDPTVPGNPTSPIRKYDIVIRNPGKSSVHYTFNGRPSLISGEKVDTWNVKNTSSTIVVSFDNGNNQTVTYDLGEGRYVFQWNNGVLNLFKD